MVEAPEQYPWSSARAHVSPNEATFLVDHEIYLGLGATPRARADAYLGFARTPINDVVLAEIRLAIKRGVPFGSDTFKDQIEHQLGRRVRLRKPGRKPKR
jgi:putative transposase